MIFNPLDSKTDHSFQIQFIHQGNNSIFDIQTQVPRSNSAPEQVTGPLQGHDPSQRAEGTPPKGANSLKPFIKRHVEVQTKGKPVFPRCATAARRKLGQACQDRNLPRCYLGFLVLFEERISDFCRALTWQLQRLLYLYSQPQAALSSSWYQARRPQLLFKGSAPHPAVLHEGAITAQLAPGTASAVPWESSLPRSPVNQREKKGVTRDWEFKLHRVRQVSDKFRDGVD